LHRSQRQRIAALLAGLAVLGLVVAPLAHSEEHLREAEEEAGGHEDNRDHGDEREHEYEHDDEHEHAGDHERDHAGDHERKHAGDHERGDRQHDDDHDGDREHSHHGHSHGGSGPHLIPRYLSPDRAQGPPAALSLLPQS
jgi:hypothetical protein